MTTFKRPLRGRKRGGMESHVLRPIITAFRAVGWDWGVVRLVRWHRGRGRGGGGEVNIRVVGGVWLRGRSRPFLCGGRSRGGFR